jgi:hypothetical protein
MASERDETDGLDPCGCGLWLCRDCRPENFPAPVPESCDNPFGRSAAKRREVDHGRA